MSVACVVIFIGFFAIRTKSLFSGDRSFKFIMDVTRRDELIDLIDLGFFFAVEKMPEQYGELRLISTNYDSE